MTAADIRKIIKEHYGIELDGKITRVRFEFPEGQTVHFKIEDEGSGKK